MQNKPNVLYLSYDGLTDPLGQSQILPYVIGLSEHYAFTIVSFEKDERFATGRKSIQALCDQHNIRWIPLRYHKTPPVFSTLYDVWKLRRTAAALHKTSDFKIVHCRSYITALVGLWMKRALGVKFIFDMRGFWADERVDGGLWNLKNPLFKKIYGFFKIKEKQFLTEADEVISLTHNARNEIQSWNINTPITVIPCCVDMKLFDRNKVLPATQTELRESLGLEPGKFVLLYLGSLGTWYMMKEMLEFFSELKKIKLDAKFLVVSHDHWDLQHYAYRDDVVMIGAERKQIPAFISLASASILFIKPAFSKKASSATKMAEVLAMGVPVIANTGWGDVEEIVRKGHCGIMIGEFQEEAYREAAGQLLQLADQSPRDYQSWLKTDFSLGSGVAEYAKVFSKLA